MNQLKNLQLLVIDDDDLVLQSLELCLPDNWALQSFTTPPKLPLKEKVHAAEGLSKERDHIYLYDVCTLYIYDGNMERPTSKA